MNYNYAWYRYRYEHGKSTNGELLWYYVELSYDADKYGNKPPEYYLDEVFDIANDKASVIGYPSGGPIVQAVKKVPTKILVRHLATKNKELAAAAETVERYANELATRQSKKKVK